MTLEQQLSVINENRNIKIISKHIKKSGTKGLTLFLGTPKELKEVEYWNEIKDTEVIRIAIGLKNEGQKYSKVISIKI